jgi:hypothetical protein
VPISVVVEVDEDAMVLSVPLADAVGPPVQIGLTVRAGVEVIMVRAVGLFALERGRRTFAPYPTVP